MMRRLLGVLAGVVAVTAASVLTPDMVRADGGTVCIQVDGNQPECYSTGGITFVTTQLCKNVTRAYTYFGAENATWGAIDFFGGNSLYFPSGVTTNLGMDVLHNCYVK